MSDSIAKSLDALGEAIEKARMFRGMRMSAAQRRLIAGASHGKTNQVWREGGMANYRMGGRGRIARVAGHQAKQTGSALQRAIARRLKVKKTRAPKPVAKAKPKTLYVYRPVENAADIIAWAQSQGFKTTQPADRMHVTLAYSKTPMNWAKLTDDYRMEPDEARAERTACGCGPVMWSEDGQKRRTIKGGVREVKALGSDGAIVLAFESDTLTERWMDFKRAGASWSFPSFTPHVTLSYSGKGVDLAKVHPYAGDIVLGEECWEEIKEGGQAEAIAAETGVAKTLDQLDQIAQRLDAIEKAQANPEPAKEAA